MKTLLILTALLIASCGGGGIPDTNCELPAETGTLSMINATPMTWIAMSADYGCEVVEQEFAAWNGGATRDATMPVGVFDLVLVSDGVDFLFFDDVVIVEGQVTHLMLRIH